MRSTRSCACRHACMHGAGVVLSYLLDHGLNTAALLFTGGACALAAVVFGALAHVAANRNMPVYDISREASRSHRHAIVDLNSSAHGYQRVINGQRSAAEASKGELKQAGQPGNDGSRLNPQAARATRKTGIDPLAAEAETQPGSSVSMPPDNAGDAASALQPNPHLQVAGSPSGRPAVMSSSASQGPADEDLGSSVRGYWRALQALELEQAEASLASRDANDSLKGHPAVGDVEMQAVTTLNGSQHAQHLALEVLKRGRAEADGLQHHQHASHPGQNGWRLGSPRAGASTSTPGATGGPSPVMNGHTGASVHSGKQTAPKSKHSSHASDPNRKRVRLGFAAALVGGVLYALLLPLYNLSVNDTLHTLPPGVPSLGVYCAYFYVALASCGLSIVFAPLLLRYPVRASARSGVARYLKDNHCRAWCVLAGVCLWIGDLAQFMGGQGAGFGVAYLVSAAPLVSTVLGIILFGEFRMSSWPAKACLAAQVVFYAASIAFLIASAKTRS